MDLEDGLEIPSNAEYLVNSRTIKDFCCLFGFPTLESTARLFKTLLDFDRAQRSAEFVRWRQKKSRELATWRICKERFRRGEVGLDHAVWTRAHKSYILTEAMLLGIRSVDAILRWSDEDIEMALIRGI